MAIPTKINDLIENENTKKMIGDYLDGRIKSLDELTLKINNAGFVISRRSVAGYLSELKNKLKPQQAEVINYNLLRCTSTKDNENLYIIGNEEQKNYWKYSITNSQSGKDYATCVSCHQIRKNDLITSG